MYYVTGKCTSRRKGDPTRGQDSVIDIVRPSGGIVTWALRLGARNDDYPRQGSGRRVWLRRRRSCALRRLVTSNV
jgi:hypothetical protein